MRNQQQESGSRYQFRLHPAATTIEEEQLQQQQQQHNHNNNNNNNVNINSKDSNNKCVKAPMSASMKSLTGALAAGGAAALKDANTAAMMQRKQFTPTSDASNASFSSASVAGSIQDDMSDQCSLTQAGLEEYNIRSSSYYDQPVLFHHQKQSSYAQSEGYHSYVSSSDSSSATPFLDRLRQESELLSRQSHHWSQNDLSSVSCNSVAPSPTPILLAMNGRDGDAVNSSDNCGDHQQQNNSSESTSSTETLKWLGSMSDVSEASHVTGYSAISESVSSSQLIVHSSRVRTPKRHHSESVLYLNNELQHAPQQQPTQARQHLNAQPHQHHQHQHPHHNHYTSPAQISPTLSAREPSPTISLSSSLRISPHHRHSPSYPPLHTTHSHTHTLHAFSVQQPPKKESISMGLPNSSLADSSTASNSCPSALFPATACDSQQHKSSISVTISSSEALVAISPQPAPVVACSEYASMTASNSANDVNSAPPPTTAAALSKIMPLSIVTGSNMPPTAAAGSGSSSSSSSSASSTATAASGTASLTGNSAASYRSNHRLFPVSTYTEPVHSNTSQYVQHPKPQYSSGLQKPVQQQQQQPLRLPSPSQQQLLAAQPSWQSVAELINDFERTNEQHPQKYSYIDPSKTHRVSNPALKAFQKNAVQSYFERQQQQQQQHQHHQHQQQQHSKEHNQQKIYQMHASQQLLQQQQMLRPHSFQPTASAKEIAEQPLLRNSLPNTFATAVTSSYQQLPSPHMRGQHEVGNPTHCSNKPPSPAPPPPPPRTRSLMPTLLRRSSSASDYAEFRDQYIRASQEKLQAQSVKNISSSEKSSFNDCGMPPPPPPPRGRALLPPRRTSSASEYAAMRDKVLQQQAAALAQHRHRAPHQYYAPTPPALATHAQSTENWVPERPPKNPSLRVPSPDLPPPPTEVDTSLSDEPLPPPPPEILHHQAYYEPTSTTQPTFMLGGELLPKPPSPNRRNSFAGSSTRKSSTSLFNRSTSATNEQPAHATPTPPPPIIPKKPSSIEQLQTSRPASSIAQQCNKAHKVMLNGSSSQPQIAQTINSSPPPLPAMSKINVNRKRPHNPAAVSNIPPILENPTSPISNSNTNKASATSSPAVTNVATTTVKSGTKCSPPPPPLKPRMPFGNQGTAAALSSKLRCNSKASYLPRQSLEKLNNTDPDHGSYKLTLTSNEDLVGHTKPAYDILAHNAKLPNNLPDVLPLGAKFQAQPASPTSANGSPLRYSSSSNLSTATVPTSTQQQPPNCYSPMYPAQHRYSTPAMTSSKNHYNHTNNNNQAPSYTRSQSYDVNSNACIASPTKFMSQSTFDLKKTHNLETTLEETTTPTTPVETSQILSPAQSENNLSSSNYHSNKSSSVTSTTTKPPSPHSARSEFTRNDMTRTLSLEERSVSTEGRIVRAELVNTTLPISPCNTVNKVPVTRKDSLRENIEKITQLQSQLMSAHLSDTGLLSNYGVKSTYSLQSPKAEVEELISKVQTANEERVSELLAEQNDAESNLSTCDAPQPPALPKTPPPTQPDSEAEEFNEVIPVQFSQMDSDIDGLKLIQRSEIILRVNPTTVETASQTDDLPDCDMGRLTESHQHLKEDAQTRTTLKPRQRHPIELDCEQISKELAELLAPNDKLIDVLTPSTIKSPADYVSNLYNPDVPQRPSKRDVGTSTLMRMKSQRETMCDPIEKSSVTMELQYAEIEVSLSNGSESDNCDMLKKKVDELIKQLNLKLKILNKEQATIGDESAINDELGSNLVVKLADKVRPLEATKFRTYIDDVGHITSLLLSLSERLAKAENMLFTIEADNAEKILLEAKRDRLLEQLEEAKRLKEDIERRGTSLAGMLEKNLSADEFADFDYFINMKAKLIADTRDIADKIKCGEEQLNALSEALIQSDC